jgi:hypothetical protein
MNFMPRNGICTTVIFVVVLVTDVYRFTVLAIMYVFFFI